MYLQMRCLLFLPSRVFNQTSRYCIGKSSHRLPQDVIEKYTSKDKASGKSQGENAASMAENIATEIEFPEDLLDEENVDISHCEGGCGTAWSVYITL